MKSANINLPYILAISIASAFGGLLFGYDWVVIGGAKPFYEPFFQITNSPYLQGWAMGSALIGCLAGAWLSGLLSDAYGRKKLLLLAEALFVVASIGTGRDMSLHNSEKQKGSPIKRGALYIMQFQLFTFRLSWIILPIKA